MRIVTREIVLPFPDKVLSPNCGVGRLEKSRHYKRAKLTAYVTTQRTLGAGHRLQIPEGCDRQVGITLIVTPPSRRRMDEDNMLARCKAYIDGVASALGVDDCRFHYREQIWKPAQKPGTVGFTIDYETPDQEERDEQ
jgi:crossover junction endodeoxyribonuclease RusA